MGRERLRTFAFRAISQIGIRYTGSPLSEPLTGLPDDAPRPGERFPWLHLKFSSDGPVEDLFARLDDTCFNLIVIGRPSLPHDPPDMDGLMMTHRPADDPVNERELARCRIPNPSFYLLRPDGHIGLAGTRLDPAALTRYLTERLELRSGPATS
jgi:hypothetical protein